VREEGKVGNLSVLPTPGARWAVVLSSLEAVLTRDASAEVRGRGGRGEEGPDTVSPHISLKFHPQLKIHAVNEMCIRRERESSAVPVKYPLDTGCGSLDPKGQKTEGLPQWCC
jgi:hypothetical protein